MTKDDETHENPLDLNPTPILDAGEGALTGLGNAHRGYVYQDVVTAYFLARAVVNGAQTVTVDRKFYEGDCFDDLTIQQQGWTVRRQFKSSADTGKPFAEEAIKTKTSDLRIDDIVHCFLSAGNNPANEYRICVTWTIPNDPEVASLLLPCDETPSFDGYRTKLFRLNVEKIWPEGGKLIWNLRGGRDFSRNDLLAFAERLIVELECPQISLDLAAPGPLQVLLRELLTDRIGVGSFPNQNVRADDAAIRLTHRASIARAGQESLSPQDVLRALNLRTDFGRVAQTFPVVRERLVSRDAVINLLRERVVRGDKIVLIGSPGSGKSWLLTQFADRYAANGALVIRHYCFLEPGDDLLERRIKSDVLFGNLIAELFEAEPTLQCEDVPRLAAGPRELKLLLAEAHRQKPERQILIVVDGLDHIERVGADAQDISPAETRIVEELAALELPACACLLMGSQPGSHLAALGGNLSSIELAGWTEGEVRELADRLGALRRVRDAFGESEAQSYVVSLHERSDGNPLYATYLCRETRQAIESGDARGPTDVVHQTPQYDGDLNNYYRYIVGSGAPDVAASILAYIDFSITRSELGQLYPVITSDLSRLLSKLAPVVTDVTGQGGLRVYHESFRRFIIESLENHPELRDDVLRTITGWLTSRGFPKDSRAFRYLFKYLFRQSRHIELLNLFGFDFVCRSIENGQSSEAILQNIVIAAQAASAICDWPSLCRITEVRKSVDVCFNDRFDFEKYTKANLAVNGAERVVNQLLFDGKPTISRDEGLIACARCDQLGVTPPWREYLKLDGSHAIAEREAAALAEFLGRAKLSTAEETSNGVLAWLRHISFHPRNFTLGILRHLSQTFGTHTVLALATADQMPARAQYLIQLSLAELAWNSREFARAANHANQALALVDDVIDAIDCLELGAAPSGCAGLCPKIDEMTQTVVDNSYPDEEMIRRWVASIRVVSFLDPELLSTIHAGIVVDGWYRAWIRFAISVSLTVVQSRTEPVASEALVVSALEDLSKEVDPFRGTPRACDLYGIRHEIHRIWGRAIALIKSSELLPRALNCLSQISDSTTVYLEGSPNGPLTMDELVLLCEPLLPHPTVIELLERQVKRAETGLYSVQAPLELQLAAAYAMAGRLTDSLHRWHRGCQCLTAYGEHRDITIYELINSFGFLFASDRERASSLIGDLQPLVESLDGRTNGKDTTRALVKWFEALASASPGQAAVLLARSLLKGGGATAWRLEDSLVTVLLKANHSRPDILLALWFTTPRDAENQPIESILNWIGDILENDRKRGLIAFQRLLSRVLRFSSSPPQEDLTALQTFAKDLGIGRILPEAVIPSVVRPEILDVGLDPSRERVCFKIDEPQFQFDASSLQMSQTIKTGGHGRLNSNEFRVRSINAIGYRILQFSQANRIDEAVWLILVLATETMLTEKANILSELAAGLARYNQPRLAALAFALAGWNCRPQFILETNIDEMHLGFIERARENSPEHADSALANEVARCISSSDGYFFGATARMIQIVIEFYGEDVGFKCWTEAYHVIQYRLPEWQNLSSEFLRYVPTDFADWTTDEALAFLLLSRVSHPDLDRKQSAIADLAQILQSDPEVLNKGLRLSLDRDTPLTSVLLILSTLLEAEPSPFVCSRYVAESLLLLQQCDSHGLRNVAKRLHDRINPEGTV